ncbi:MAG TPA: hypothetical protein VFR90_08925 [Methylibium sp.]|uniref:hypothetical protein n=1 Tax=Methylibium sp. TaxID=2067992 RepID=UPI002DBCA0AD|nr:hypothetical protein [Methylibium sp.]HEU4459230.1 hypothetical protein [Methylibium sp.]
MAVLAFGFVQRGVHDMPVAFAWFMIILSAPVGLLIVALIGVATSEASQALGLAYHPFVNLLPLWVAAVIGGYVQWFVAVPWVARKVFRRGRASNPLLQRTASGGR